MRTPLDSDDAQVDAGAATVVRARVDVAARTSVIQRDMRGSCFLKNSEGGWDKATLI
jgi:hypothetical protein